MGVRLATSVLVGALIRKVEGEGGFAAVLAKGDESAGSVIVILTERGANPRPFERILQADGLYAWQAGGDRLSLSPAEVPAFIARRRRFDPDLWVIELDVPSAERFAAEMNSFG
jgi:hypothetical protein